MTYANIDQILRDTTQRYGGKRSACQVFDSNVCTSKSTPDRPWELEAISGEPFTTLLRFTFRGKKIKLFANHDYLDLVLATNLQLEPLSINQAEKGGPPYEFAAEITFGHRRCPIFTPSGSISSDQDGLLKSDQCSELIRILDIQEGEGIHVSKSEISIYIHARSPESFHKSLDAALNLLARFETAPSTRSFQAMPQEFRILIPLIEAWATSNDVDRNALIEDADRSTLESLVSCVEPAIKPINDFLNSFGEQPLDDAAMALGQLVEAAEEAKLRLQSRRTAQN
jgi:hypothetical protein